MFLVLRKERGLTLSRKKGGGIWPILFLNICHGKIANPQGLKFFEFFYLTMDKRTEKILIILWGVPPLAPQRGCCPKMAYDHHSLTLSVRGYWILLTSGGGHPIPPPRKSMKELFQTSCCYIEVKPISKMSSHEKNRVEISKFGWDFEIWKFEEIEISPRLGSRKYP